MKCTRCGRALDADSRFCEGCGAPVAPSPTPEVQAPAPPAFRPELPAPPNPMLRSGGTSPPQPASAPPGPGRSRLVVPLALVGCGCLLVLFLAGGLGLWWWLDRPGGFEIPPRIATPGPSPDTASPPDPSPASAPDSREEPVPPSSDGPAEPDAIPLAGADPETGTPRTDPDEVEWGPQAGIPVILFEDQGDVNGDGRVEKVQIAASDGNGDPTTATPRRFRVVDESGLTLFQTDEFTEPFLPELDHLADQPWNRAGIHVVKGSGRWPEIRIVFASASGNFVVFRFDGSTYRAVETGQ